MTNEEQQWDLISKESEINQQQAEIYRLNDLVIVLADTKAQQQAEIDRFKEHCKKLEATVWEQAEINTEQSGQIDRLQVKITEFAGIILDYESKWDILAENEAKRCIEFGEAVRNEVDKEVDNTRIQAGKTDSHAGDYADNLLYTLEQDVQSIDIKSIYTNFKKG